MSFDKNVKEQAEKYTPKHLLQNPEMDALLLPIHTAVETHEKEKNPDDNVSCAEAKNCIAIKPQELIKTFEMLGDNVWEYNVITDHTKFSKPVIDIINWKTNDEDNLFQLWLNHVHPNDKLLLNEMKENYKQGKIDNHNIEYRIISKRGTIHWILDRGLLVEKTWDGKPARALGTHTEITKIKETEQALRESDQSFRLLAENIPGVLYKLITKNKKSYLSYISPNAEDKIGITPEQLEDFYGILHPNDYDRELEIRKKTWEQGIPYRFEGRFVLPDKPVIWLSIASSITHIDKDGTITYTGIATNITKEKEAELALQLREEKYRNIIANMNLRLMEVDNNDIIGFVNNSFCEMSGYKEAELIGKKAALFFQQKNSNMHSMNEKKLIRKNGYSDAYEKAVKNKKGESKWWLVSSALRYNDEGNLVGSIGIHLDITQQKMLQEELLVAKKQAEESAKSRQVFLANMSHEIRTPMNAIIGMSNQLAKTFLNKTQRKFLETIHSAADNLLIVINDVLDLSKMEAGKLNLENIGFSLKEVINRAVHVVEHKAEEKGLLLQMKHFDTAIFDVLLGDPYRINQVLLNLLSNAVKFTESGSISLSCSITKSYSYSQLIEIAVEDTGIGMEADFIDKIFEAFNQEYNSVTRKYGGTGLGMNICKQLVEMMGGTIRVQSKKGKGTKITFSIEFAKGYASDIRNKEIMPFEVQKLKGKKILVTDDNDMNRFLLKVIFENYDTIIFEARNGQEAIEILREEPDMDIVLMDIQMPVMDGIQATRIMREELKSKVPIIALTANAIKGDHEGYFKAGMNSYVFKPFNEDELLRTIIKWSNSNDYEVTEVPAEKENNESRYKLYNLSQLVAISRGDNDFVIKMIKVFIQQANIFKTEIADAIQQKNLEKLAAIAHKFKPSISNICQPFMYNDIKRLEQLALQDEYSEQLIEISDKFQKNIEEVTLQLQEEL